METAADMLQQSNADMEIAADMLQVDQTAGWRIAAVKGVPPSQASSIILQRNAGISATTDILQVDQIDGRSVVDNSAAPPGPHQASSIVLQSNAGTRSPQLICFRSAKMRGEALPPPLKCPHARPFPSFLKATQACPPQLISVRSGLPSEWNPERCHQDRIAPTPDPVHHSSKQRRHIHRS